MARFSQVAFAAVVVIVATGVIQGWRQVGSYDALFDTAYGRLLVFKVVLFAGMLVAASFSRTWIRNRAVAQARALALSPGPGAVAASADRGPAGLAVLRRSVAAEVALAVGVLAVTAMLVNAVPGASTGGSGPGGPFATQVHGETLMVQVAVDPVTVGQSDVKLTVTDHGLNPLEPEEVQASLSLPERDLGPHHPDVGEHRSRRVRRLRRRDPLPRGMAAGHDGAHQRHRPDPAHDRGPGLVDHPPPQGARPVKTRAVTRALGVAVLALVALAPMASAHVTVNPGEVEKGSFARLTFRVPNERDDAGTTSLEVNLPEDQAFPFVSVRPLPGWTATTEMRTLDEPIDAFGEQVTEVVSKITWTGGTINPGEFQEFDVSIGRMPEDVDSIEFPSIQTYSSGEIVRWIDPVVEGEEEPEHPAPTLHLIDPAPRGRGRAPVRMTPPRPTTPPPCRWATSPARTTSTRPSGSPPSAWSWACSAWSWPCSRWSAAAAAPAAPAAATARAPRPRRPTPASTST